MSTRAKADDFYQQFLASTASPKSFKAGRGALAIDCSDLQRASAR